MTLLCVGQNSGHTYKLSQRKPTRWIYPRSYDTYKMLPDTLMKSANYYTLVATTRWVGLYNLILGYGFLSHFHSLHMQNSKNATNTPDVLWSFLSLKNPNTRYQGPMCNSRRFSKQVSKVSMVVFLAVLISVSWMLHYQITRQVITWLLFVPRSSVNKST